VRLITLAAGTGRCARRRRRRRRGAWRSSSARRDCAPGDRWLDSPPRALLPRRPRLRHHPLNPPYQTRAPPTTDTYSDRGERVPAWARRQSVMEMIAAQSSSIDAADSVNEAQGPRRGPASPSWELGGARWPPAGVSADAATESGSSRLLAPRAACRRSSRSVAGSRLEQGGGGRSWDEEPAGGDRAGV
jgi:hypothetical protein